MRIKNLFIIIAIVAVIILIFRYVQQVRDTKNGNRVINDGQVFVNWFLAICLVVSLIGIGITSVAEHHQKQSSAAKTVKTVKKTAPVKHKKVSEDKVTLKFKQSSRLNANGVANVAFTVSPKTTLTIKGHKSGETFATFNAGTGKSNLIRRYTFETPGQYDIIAKRGKKTITKKMTIKSYTSASSSSSSTATSQTYRNTASSNTAASGAAASNSTASTGNAYTGTAAASTAGNSSRQSATQSGTGSARANANSASAAGSQSQQSLNGTGAGTTQSTAGNTAAQLGY